MPKSEESMNSRMTSVGQSEGSAEIDALKYQVSEINNASMRILTERFACVVRKRAHTVFGVASGRQRARYVALYLSPDRLRLVQPAD